jgi:hypothetical protein
VSFPNIPFEEGGCCLGTNLYNLVKVMTLEYFFPEYSPENVEIPESFDIGTVSTKEFLSDISVLKLFSENSIPIPYSNRNIFDRLYDITNE